MSTSPNRLIRLVLATWMTVAVGMATTASHAADIPGQFDYYLLSLSWSPAFCLSKGKSAPQDQCGSKRYGFVVHGLWPQNEVGWPANCNAQPEDVPPDVVQQVLPIMPSKQLIEHEWDKHGKCSGLDAVGYFKQIETSFNQLHIPEPLQNPVKAIRISPEKLKQGFLDANPDANFSSDSIAVTCSGKTLSEVHICLDKSLKVSSCSNEVLKQQCRKATVLVPPLR